MQLRIHHLPRYLKLYLDASGTALDGDELAGYITSLLPSLPVEVRDEPARHFLSTDEALYRFASSIAAARVFRLDADEVITEPFKAEIDYEYRRIAYDMPNMFGAFYSAHHMQSAYWELIPREERSLSHVHVVVTKLLIGTFEVLSRRWHARTITLGFPNIISLRGLIEAPAKPREFYILKQAASVVGGEVPTEMVIYELRKHALIGLDDERLTDVTKGYLLQAIVYHATLNPFCEDDSCRLYNAHWQQEMLKAQLDGDYELCEAHRQLLNAIEERLRREAGS
ncbi:MAG: hypothetical protein RMK18_01705 [Armatimonadota bacterium]|nr:hypothetical protein [Armatimonadota bacterium]MCX7776774.1 hypothetical protein [Armatimonadota bacterium]MDW8024571.1 hypothetical protein [Armatimonadota bacterium]